MIHSYEIDDAWIIPIENFNNVESIGERVGNATMSDRPSLKSALGYLYLDNGAKTLDKERLKLAEKYLTPAERRVLRWLQTRSNGSERRKYGPGCVIAARQARFRCLRCGCPDSRTLQIDHVNGRGDDVERAFECLCANCHQIKSAEKNWMSPPEISSLQGPI